MTEETKFGVLGIEPGVPPKNVINLAEARKEYEDPVPYPERMERVIKKCDAIRLELIDELPRLEADEDKSVAVNKAKILATLTTREQVVDAILTSTTEVWKAKPTYCYALTQVWEEKYKN